MNKLSTSKVWEIVGKISESKTLKSVCVISGCLAVRQAFWYLYHKYYHLPHGPIGLPFIGSLIQLSLQSHSYLTWINMKYGNIASAYLGNARIVMINDPGLYKQIGSKKEFEHRPFKEKKNHRVVRHVRPLPFINGPEWKIRRKNFFKAMTEMMKSEIIDNVIKCVMKETIIPLIDERMKQENISINSKDCRENINGIVISDICHLAVLNTLYLGAFGKQLQPNDPNYVLLRDWIDAVFSRKNPFYPGRFSNAFRKIIHFFDKNARIEDERMKNAILNKRRIFHDIVSLNMQTYDEKNLKSFVDYMINSSKENQQLTFEQVLDDVGTVFTAGTDTTASSIEACIYYAAMHPHLQQQMYQEIYQCIQTKQSKESQQDFFKFAMIHQCPIFRAFIYESLRMFYVGMVSPARTCLKDTNVEYQGTVYNIPSNTIVIAATMNLSFNQAAWGDNANQFDVNRFLLKDSDDQLKFNTKLVKDYFHLFGFGRRDCPGQTLAMKDVVMILANLLLKYKFLPVNNEVNQLKKDFETNIRYYSVNKFEPSLKLMMEKRKEVQFATQNIVKMNSKNGTKALFAKIQV